MMMRRRGAAKGAKSPNCAAGVVSRAEFGALRRSAASLPREILAIRDESSRSQMAGVGVREANASRPPSPPPPPKKSRVKPRAKPRERKRSGSTTLGSGRSPSSSSVKKKKGKKKGNKKPATTNQAARAVARVEEEAKGADMKTEEERTDLLSEFLLLVNGTNTLAQRCCIGTPAEHSKQLFNAVGPSSVARARRRHRPEEDKAM